MLKVFINLYHPILTFSDFYMITFARPLGLIGKSASYLWLVTSSPGRSSPSIVYYVPSQMTVYVTTHQHQYEISFFDMAFVES